MNKKFAAAAMLLAGITLGLVSCNKDTSFHTTQVNHPLGGGTTLYADQDLDSIIFTVSDDWRLATTYDWIHIQGKTQGTIKEAMSIYTLINHVRFDENTTDSTRIGTIALSAYNSSAAIYVQFGFIDITYPYYRVRSYYGTTNIPTKVSFTIKDSANVTTDSICFNARKDWTLEIQGGDEASWVSASKTSGRAGKQNVTISMTQNEAYLPREAKAILTSGNVKNEITIWQAAKPKPKN